MAGATKAGLTHRIKSVVEQTYQTFNFINRKNNLLFEKYTLRLHQMDNQTVLCGEGALQNYSS